MIMLVYWKVCQAWRNGGLPAAKLRNRRCKVLQGGKKGSVKTLRDVNELLTIHY